VLAGLALGFALLGLAAGTSCGGSAEPGSDGGSPTGSATVDDNLPPVEDRCPGGSTRPIAVETVIEVARRHGITLYDDPQCQTVPSIVRQASNIVRYGPNANIVDQDEISEREGDVRCEFERESAPALRRNPPAVERVHYATDEETYFTFLNVDCVIYPNPEDAETQLRRLQQTMDELRTLWMNSEI
jgi:hypothetical protein